MSGSYVPGFKHDMFVSYAHVDDAPSFGAEHGWVSTLLKNLVNLLAVRLGRREIFSAYTDHSLLGHGDIDDHLLEAVRNSATLVVVLSEAWAASKYSQKELSEFLQRRGVEAGSRNIFVVEKLKLTGDRPDGLPNSRGYGFWYEDERGVTHTYATFNYKEPELDYCKRLDQLAQELANHLNALRIEALARTPEVAAAPLDPQINKASAQASGPRTKVVLAEVTDDLLAQRAVVSRYLFDQNYEVLPAETYRWVAPEKLKDAVTADLRESVGFIQLLSETPGYTGPQVPYGFPWLQHHAAKEFGAKIIQWRKPDIDPKSIDLSEYRALLTGETVHAMPLHDFKKFLVEALRPPPVVPFEYPGAIFINADQPDLEVARQFKKDLEGEFPVVIPSAAGDPEELRVMMDEYLTNCESVVMLYGTTKPTWIDRQLWRFNRVARKRERPPRLLAVLDIMMPPDESEVAPDKSEEPSEKPKPSVGLPGLTALSALGIEAGLTLLRQHLAAA